MSTQLNALKLVKLFSKLVKPFRKLVKLLSDVALAFFRTNTRAQARSFTLLCMSEHPACCTSVTPSFSYWLNSFKFSNELSKSWYIQDNTFWQYKPYPAFLTIGEVENWVLLYRIVPKIKSIDTSGRMWSFGATIYLSSTIYRHTVKPVWSKLQRITPKRTIFSKGNSLSTVTDV